MKKLSVILSCIFVVFSVGFLVACDKNNLYKPERPPETDQNPSATIEKYVEINITETEHCKMTILDAKDRYVPFDDIRFDYDIDDGYALECVKVEIENDDGISVQEYGFTLANIFFERLYDWKKVTYTPIITDNVDCASEIRAVYKFGGKGSVKWMFDYVAKGQEDNWICIEPDENSYVQSGRACMFYGDPSPLGGDIIDMHPEYDGRTLCVVAMSFKSDGWESAYDEIYTEVVFIKKSCAVILNFACKNDFERTRPYGIYAAALSTVSVVCTKGEEYYYNFYLTNNLDAIVYNGYEFVGWTDETGNMICDTLSGSFSADRDKTFYITFRDLYA